jgi:diamine N-acetyltransferase
MEDIKLRKATVADIPAISELARLVWNQHYPSIISQEQIDYMLNMMYSATSLREQMEIKKHVFYIIETASAQLGFVSVCEEMKDRWFLGKFYINQNTASKGMGTKAFELLLEKIRPQEITLTVNRQNYKSINFYFKLGFQIERVADFDIGNGYVMNDFVMKFKA